MKAIYVIYIINQHNEFMPLFAVKSEKKAKKQVKETTKFYKEKMNLDVEVWYEKSLFHKGLAIL